MPSERTASNCVFQRLPCHWYSARLHKTVVSPALGDFQPKGLSLVVSGPPPWPYRAATMESREGRTVGLSSMETGPVPKAEKAGYNPESMDGGRGRVPGASSSPRNSLLHKPRAVDPLMCAHALVCPDQSPLSYYKYYVASDQLHSVNTG